MGTQRSTEDITEYKRGPVEGLRGIYQNKTPPTLYELMETKTTADNVYWAFTMVGTTLWQLHDI